MLVPAEAGTHGRVFFHFTQSSNKPPLLATRMLTPASEYMYLDHGNAHLLSVLPVLYKQKDLKCLFAEF